MAIGFSDSMFKINLYHPKTSNTRKGTPEREEITAVRKKYKGKKLEGYRTESQALRAMERIIDPEDRKYASVSEYMDLYI